MVKRRVIAFLFLLVVSIFLAGAVTAFSGAGSGTDDDPYEIENWYHLNETRNDLNSNYVLVNNIDENTDGYIELASDSTDKFYEAGNEITAEDLGSWDVDKKGETFYLRFTPLGKIIDSSAEVGIVDEEKGIIELEEEVVGYFEVTYTSSEDQYRGWNPIGSQDSHFKGVLDGNGYNISDLYVNRGQENYGALFAFTGEDAKIRNIGLIDFESIGENYIGGLVADNFGVIENCFSTGSSFGNTNTGGLIAYSSSLTKDSYFEGEVRGNFRTGGLIGRQSRGEIRNSYSKADVEGRGYVGGLVGYSDSDIVNSYSVGNVQGISDLGGLAGKFYTGHIENSYYNLDGSLLNGDKVITHGAIYGGHFDEWLENDKSLDASDYFDEENGYYLLSDFNDLKKLLVFSQDSSLKFRMNDDIDLSGHESFYIPIMAGEFDGDGNEISNIDVSILFSEPIGFFGRLYEGGVLENLGVVDSSLEGNDDVGGLAGINEGRIKNSYFSGDVEGRKYVGGLTGINDEVDDEGHILNSYSSGGVAGDENVGGLAGSNSEGRIKNSYSVSEVSGDSIGGLVGFEHGDTEVESSFWDKEETGVEESNGGIGKTTEEMKDIETFNVAGWDIAFKGQEQDETWFIDDGNDYPMLNLEYEVDEDENGVDPDDEDEDENGVDPDDEDEDGNGVDPDDEDEDGNGVDPDDEDEEGTGAIVWLGLIIGMGVILLIVVILIIIILKKTINKGSEDNLQPGSREEGEMPNMVFIFIFLAIFILFFLFLFYFFNIGGVIESTSLSSIGGSVVYASSELPKPENLANRNITYDSFEAVWDPVENAAGYFIQLSETYSFEEEDIIAELPEPGTFDQDYYSDRLGVVAYSSSASLRHELSDDWDSVEDTIRGLSAGGLTASGPGIDLAREHLVDESDEDKSRVILFMSDGKSNRGRDPEYAARDAYEDHGIVVHSIGLGSGVRESEMSGVAEEGGGVYVHAETNDDLQPLYEEMLYVSLDRMNETATFDNLTYKEDYYWRIRGLGEEDSANSVLMENSEAGTLDDEEDEEVGVDIMFAHDISGSMRIGPLDALKESSYDFIETLSGYTPPEMEDSEWAYHNVTIMPQLDAPENLSIDGDEITISSFEAAWDEGDDRTEEYEIEVASDSNFNNVLGGASEDGISGTSHEVSPLASDSQYYWRVRGKSPGDYNPSEWVEYETLVNTKEGLKTAHWEDMDGDVISEAHLNDTVKLVASGEGFEGYEVEFTVIKEGFLWFDSEVAQISTEAFTTWKANKSGTYTFEAIRSDSPGGDEIVSGELEVSDTVNNEEPSVEIVYPGDNDMFLNGTEIEFKANFRDKDDDLRAEWDFGDGESITEEHCSSTGNCNVSNTFNSPGSYNVEVMVEEMDRKNPNRASDSVIILVFSEGLNPSPIITKPEDEGFIGKEIEFSAEDSYTANCTGGATGECIFPDAPAGADELGEGDCYLVCSEEYDDCEDAPVNQKLYCFNYPTDDDWIGEKYDLLFNWEFFKDEEKMEGHDREGRWSEDYEYVVEFDKTFPYSNVYYSTELKMGFEFID